MASAEQTTLEWLLLPVGYKFTALTEANDGSYYPSIHDLWVSLPLAILLTLLRKFVVERIIGRRIGMMLGLKPRDERPSKHLAVLYQVFLSSPSRVPEERVAELSQATGLDEHGLERFWARQQRLRKPSALTKFEEAFWRLLFYTVSFSWGLYVCLGSAHFWDTELLWIKNPRHHVPERALWYYTVELALYLSLVVSQFTDVRRKDFVQMFIHHIVTISLIVMSWWANMVRIGVMVLLYHDISDIFLEAAKCFKYAKYAIADVLFVLFAITFIVMRLGFYAYHVVLGTFTEAPVVIDANFPSAISFRALLLALLALHVFWTWIILKMAMQLKQKGELEGDLRSDLDEEEDDVEGEGPGEKGGKGEKAKAGEKAARKAKAHAD